jgi:hypothetical protein
MDQRDDLGLWLRYLHQATDGISLNLITFWLLTHIGRSDACEHGIGGFSAMTGVAWQWEIPLELRWRVTLNVLEYLVGYVTLWMEILVGNAPQGLSFSLKQIAPLWLVGFTSRASTIAILYTWKWRERQRVSSWTTTLAFTVSGFKGN